MKQKHDPVNHPSYYCEGGIETLDFILAKKMDFLTGQVIKYLVRAGKKDPAKEIEDHEKARFYLDKKISLLKEKQENGEVRSDEAHGEVARQDLDKAAEDDDVIRKFLTGGSRL